MNIENKILNVLKNVFKQESINTDCSQKNCENWDSLKHLDLIVELESEFDVEFEPEEIAEMKSYNEIRRILELKGI